MPISLFMKQTTNTADSIMLIIHKKLDGHLPWERKISLSALEGIFTVKICIMKLIRSKENEEHPLKMAKLLLSSYGHTKHLENITESGIMKVWGFSFIYLSTLWETQRRLKTGFWSSGGFSLSQSESPSAQMSFKHRMK